MSGTSVACVTPLHFQPRPETKNLSMDGCSSHVGGVLHPPTQNVRNSEFPVNQENWRHGADLTLGIRSCSNQPPPQFPLESPRRLIKGLTPPPKKSRAASIELRRTASTMFDAQRKFLENLNFLEAAVPWITPNIIEWMAGNTSEAVEAGCVGPLDSASASLRKHLRGTRR